MSAQQVSEAGRQVDLNYVTQQVTTLHPNYFYQLDRAVFIVSGAVASNGTTIWVK